MVQALLFLECKCRLAGLGLRETAFGMRVLELFRTGKMFKFGISKLRFMTRDDSLLFMPMQFQDLGLWLLLPLGLRIELPGRGCWI